MKTRTLVKLGQDELLDRKIERIYGDVLCKCEYSYEGTGRFNGIDMGKDWVRITTHPACRHHGPCPKGCTEDHYHRRPARTGRGGLR